MKIVARYWLVELSSVALDCVRSLMYVALVAKQALKERKDLNVGPAPDSAVVETSTGVKHNWSDSDIMVSEWEMLLAVVEKSWIAEPAMAPLGNYGAEGIEVVRMQRVAGVQLAPEYGSQPLMGHERREIFGMSVSGVVQVALLWGQSEEEDRKDWNSRPSL